jgi:hypothetical protein
MSSLLFRVGRDGCHDVRCRRLCCLAGALASYVPRGAMRVDLPSRAGRVARSSVPAIDHRGAVIRAEQ